MRAEELRTVAESMHDVEAKLRIADDCDQVGQRAGAEPSARHGITAALRAASSSK
jgi:hypothetical protein